MGKAHSPRCGSMQYWPRKRAKRHYPRVRSWSAFTGKLLGFAGYKAGMTHVIMTDNRPNTKTKGQDIAVPVTVIECPPLKTLSLRLYQKNSNGSSVVAEYLSDNLDKHLSRKVTLPKKKKDMKETPAYDEIRFVVYTQPSLTGIGKKKPDLFEISFGGNGEEELATAKELLGKEIPITDVFEAGQVVDARAVTKGKGFQGPVKRFGIDLRSHKSEKSVRNPGSLGPWTSQGHILYRVAHAGQMGYHNRTDFNKQVLKIEEDPVNINPRGDFVRYGVVRNTCLLIKGSVPGPAKRLIRMTVPLRPNKKIPTQAPTITQVSLESKQR